MLRGDGAVAIRYPNYGFSEILVTKTNSTQHRSVRRSLYTLSHNLASEIIGILFLLIVDYAIWHDGTPILHRLGCPPETGSLQVCLS